MNRYFDFLKRQLHLKKEKGASSIILVIMFFILMAVAMVVAFGQWRHQKLKILQTQDALASAVLAAAVPDIYIAEYGDLYIPEYKVPQAFEMFKDSLKSGIQHAEVAPNKFEPLDENDILVDASIADFRVYSIVTETGGKFVYEYIVDPTTGQIKRNQEGVPAITRTEFTPTAVETPNQKAVVWSSIYAKLDINIETPALRVFLGEDGQGIATSVEKVSSIVKDTVYTVVLHDWKNPNDEMNERGIMSDTFPISVTQEDLLNFLNRGRDYMNTYYTSMHPKEGYTFHGWDKTPESIMALIEAGNTLIDVYAVYSANGLDYHNVIIFDGEEARSKMYPHGYVLQDLTAKTIPGKMFLYWSHDKEGSTIVNGDAGNNPTITVTVNGDMVLWAIYSYTDAGNVAELTDEVTATDSGFQADTQWYVKLSHKKVEEVGYLLGTDPSHLDYNHELVIQEGININANVGHAVTDIPFYNTEDMTLYGRSYLKLSDKLTGAVEIIYSPMRTLEYKKDMAASDYAVFVGGIRVTDANANDIFASDPSKGNSGLAKFDLYTRTLTLSGVEAVGTASIGGRNCGVYTDTHLTINLIGDNYITGDITNGDGSTLIINDITPEYIYADANISFTGRIAQDVINNARINNSWITGKTTNNKILAGGEYYGTVTNSKTGTIHDGIFTGVTTNEGVIRGGRYSGRVTNAAGGTVKGGTFRQTFTNQGVILYDSLSTPTFNQSVMNYSHIAGGIFTGNVSNLAAGTIVNGEFKAVSNNGMISGGYFDGTVTNTAGTIKDGVFVSHVYNQSGGIVSGGVFKKFVLNRGSSVIDGASGLHQIITIDCYPDLGNKTKPRTDETVWAQAGIMPVIIDNITDMAFYKWTASGIDITKEMSTATPLSFYMPSNDVTITANGAWVATFDGNGGADGGTVKRLHNEKLGVLPDTYRIGYTFDGWFTSKANGTGVIITPTTIMPNGHVTYYAHWTPIDYTLTFDSNGGNTPNPETIVKGYELPIGTLPTVTRTGHTFLGWFTKKTGGTQISANTTVPLNGATYYAHWKVNSYTATFNANGGTAPNPSTMTADYNTAWGTLPTTSRTGYNFNGWYTAATGGTKITATTKVPASNPTYYAQWTPTAYNITYNLNGGTLNTAFKTYTIETNTTTLPTPTRSGYNFYGWYTNASFTGSPVTQITKGSHGNVTLYAKWDDKLWIFDGTQASVTKNFTNAPYSNGKLVLVNNGASMTTKYFNTTDYAYLVFTVESVSGSLTNYTGTYVQNSSGSNINVNSESIAFVHKYAGTYKLPVSSYNYNVRFHTQLAITGTTKGNLVITQMYLSRS